MTSEQNGQFATTAEMEEPTMYDMEGEALSPEALIEFRERIAKGLDEPTTTYDENGRSFHIGSYRNGEY